MKQPAGDPLVKIAANRAIYLLLVILGIALGLRVWGITFGLPYDFTYDEPHEILRALKLGAGEFDWDRGGKGGLYYLLFLEYGAVYGVWWTAGRIRSAHEFALQYLQDPSIFYLTGRLTVALMGTMTCLIIFLIGRRVHDCRVGLGAAFIGATAYFHGFWSHVINVDIGMALALWASILAYLRYEDTRKLRWLVTAGVLGGVAIAFKLPGAIVLPILLLALISRTDSWRSPHHLLKEAGIVGLTLALSLIVIAPDTAISLASLHEHFSQAIAPKSDLEGSAQGQILYAVDAVTVYQEKTWSAYLKILIVNYNLPITLGALLGAVLGLLRKHRWDIIWCFFIVMFLVILTAAGRAESEHYLLPIMPGLWLLSSRAVVIVLGHRQTLLLPAFVCTVIVPLAALVRQDYMWTKPDTRVLAKQWIEANIPAGAKILMDGMRYRFVQSPPLNPASSTVDRQVGQAADTEYVSRAVSSQTLALYRQAMSQRQGPTYRLHSTVWGIEIEDLNHYIQGCFDYIITSSANSERFVEESSRQRFPKSAQFYEQLKADSRFQVVYAVEPVPWQSSGPLITIYKVPSTCGAS
jgi:hypothetical protein